MKQTIKLSNYSILTSALILIMLLAILYLSKAIWMIYIISAIILIWTVLALFYMPMSVSIDGRCLNINRSLRIKSIPLTEISAVDLQTSPYAERRILGSNGWFGYWGWYHNADIGRYFAYYGNESDARLYIRLKDGRQYIIGCPDPQSFVNHIQKHIYNSRA